MQQIITFDSNGLDYYANNRRRYDLVRVCKHYYDDFGKPTTVLPKSFDRVRSDYMDCMFVNAVEYDMGRFDNIYGII